jgi:Flp pilus assembly protein TadG
MSIFTKLPRRAPRRRGAATVEATIALPLVALIVFGAVDSSTAISSKQTLNSAAYEGARRAIRVNSSAAEVNMFVNEFLTDAGINTATLTLTPPEPAAVSPGTPITVEIAVSSSQVSLMPWSLIGDSTIRSHVVMVKE